MQCEAATITPDQHQCKRTAEHYTLTLYHYTVHLCWQHTMLAKRGTGSRFRHAN